MAEEVIAEEPKVEEVSIPASLTTSFDAIKGKLQEVPFYSISQLENELDVVHVESRNVRKEPFLFYLVKFQKDKLSFSYSIIPNTSERLRRATVLKNVASMLAMVADDFSVSAQPLLQYVDSVLSDLLNGLNESYSALFNKYDSLLEQYSELKKLVTELTNSNRNLTIQASQLNEENKNLKAQLEALQAYSDEALMALVEDWIEVHDNTIDITEFAKTYKVTEPRVEQILDKMVSLGYISLKG